VVINPNERWSVRILGGVSVERAGQVIDRFPTRRSALILIRLALAQGRAVSRDAIAAALWPDQFSETTKPRLRQELARLKKVLGESGDIFESDRLSLRLDTSKDDIDLKDAEQMLVRYALEKRPEQKINIAEPLAQYPEEIAPGYDEPWILAVRKDWRTRTAHTLLEIAGVCETRGELERAVQLARKAASNDLLNEDVQSGFLQILVRLERHEEAAQHLAELDRVYFQQLGVGPSHRLAQWVWPRRPPEQAPITGQITAAKIKPLPAPLAELFGRACEVESVAAMLDPSSDVRLITLSGPGGIGKTQLSLTLGRQVADAYRRRVWFIALAEIESPSRIGKVILDALGIGTIDEDPIDVIASVLSKEPSLIILDNFEQLVDGGAQIVRRLLEQCTKLKLLVTTRRRLNVQGEREFPVGALSLI